MTVPEALKTDFKRLKRHYEHVEKTYDDVSLLDLSHALRVWVDIKDRLAAISGNKILSNRLFKNYSPNKQVLKNYKHTEFFITFMPDYVITHADKGNFFASRKDFKSGSTIAFRFAKDGIDGPMRVSDISYNYPSLPKETPNLNLYPVKKQLNFIEWLGAEVIRLNFRNGDGKLELIGISRKMLINRVANAFGGSHPIDRNREDQNNMYDKLIEYLFDFDFAGCPLPYFMLMKIAQDMIEFLPAIITDLD
ncbi:hypothetical protein [Methylophaga nitratireducenticrescens]|uniref:Uncharacterized protein n=1 Tax=Methylophaga nitratireducenticrescens TaxID=754476 RepID=I1XFQ3_METNJ|nr:hypothetical protein [Methylophaga nitratireducenticrescens]AFI83222.1 hypothetical protein Q7A_365 [Methylophaga nitratireducenticrescens]AUZ83354.1 hypothetical protein CDW43_01625 [Methylophaga nitratireducenticrescens]